MILIVSRCCAVFSRFPSKKDVLNAETKNFRKLRETHFQSRLILRELQKSFISQRKIKDDKLQQLQRDIKSRQDAALRREYRQKKQAEPSS